MEKDNMVHNLAHRESSLCPKRQCQKSESLQSYVCYCLRVRICYKKCLTSTYMISMHDNILLELINCNVISFYMKCISHVQKFFTPANQLYFSLIFWSPLTTFFNTSITASSFRTWVSKDWIASLIIFCYLYSWVQSFLSSLNWINVALGTSSSASL